MAACDILCCAGAVVLPLPCCAARFECIDRLVQGLSALFLALRRRPIIRYQKTSSAAQRLAEGLYALTYRQQVGERACMQTDRPDGWLAVLWLARLPTVCQHCKRTL